MPTRPVHLAEIVPQTPQQVSKPILAQIASDAQVEPMLLDLCRTLLEDEKPIAVLGLWPITLESAEAWALFSDRALALPKTIAKGTRSWLDFMAGRDRWRTFVTHMDERHAASLRWVEWLGFERVGHDMDGPDGHPLVRYERHF